MKCQCVRVLSGGYRQEDCQHDAEWVVEALPVIERKTVCRYHVGHYRKLKRNPHGFPHMTIEPMKWEELVAITQAKGDASDEE